MELWQFLRAICKHWWALLSCALFTFLGTYVLYANRTNAWAVRATLAVALFCMLLSTYLAWRELHRDLGDVKRDLALAIDRTKPKLSAEFLQITTGKITNPDGTHLMFNVSLRNTGADSVAKGWLLTVHSKELNLVKLRAVFIRDKLTLSFGNQTAVFDAQMRLEERAMQPIKFGSMTAGWLQFILINVSIESFMKSRITLHFEDVLDAPYTLERDMVQGLGDPTVGYYPGSGGNPFGS